MIFGTALLYLALFCFSIVAAFKLIGLGLHYMKTAFKVLRKKGDSVIERDYTNEKR